MPHMRPYIGSFTIPEALHVDELSFEGDLVTPIAPVRCL